MLPSFCTFQCLAQVTELIIIKTVLRDNSGKRYYHRKTFLTAHKCFLMLLTKRRWITTQDRPLAGRGIGGTTIGHATRRRQTTQENTCDVEVREVFRVTMGHLRVTIGRLRVTVGHLRDIVSHPWVTIGYLQVTLTIGHLMVNIGAIRVSIGYP